MYPKQMYVRRHLHVHGYNYTGDVYIEYTFFLRRT